MFEGGPITVSEAEILEFARRYDPQAMHTDPAAAARGHFGGLIASGWHTAALMMRLFATHFLSPVSSLASPGIDELRWLAPVRPGDALTLRVTVVEARRSRSKPDQGIVRSLGEVSNQKGEVVMTLKPISFIRCRPS
jgi:acyl dehydratase